MKNLTAQWVDINRILPYEKNAKKHLKKQVQQIADSITQFGFNQPIVVDKNNIIIVGHGRYAAAQLLEMKEVPILQVDLDEEKAKAYRLADNKLNESTWDMGLVIEELKTLQLQMVEYTGFSTDLVIEGGDMDDAVPATPEQPVSKLGDVYELNGHRLVCGDATDALQVSKLMRGVKADMVFTDPPYNVNYKGGGKKTKRTIENDHMSEMDFDVFLEKIFQRYAEIIKGGAGLYVFHSSSTQMQFQDALEKAGMNIKNQLVWNKPVASMGWGDYRWKHEPFFYAGLKDQKLKFYGDRTHSTIWDLQNDEAKLLKWVKKQKRLEQQGKTTIWSMKRDSVALYVHPTQKPVELICYAITNSSKMDDIIVDLFGGSGSTMIASEKMKRTAYIMELDPAFVDVMVQRWVDFTGKTDIIKNGKEIVWEKSI